MEQFLKELSSNLEIILLVTILSLSVTIYKFFVFSSAARKSFKDLLSSIAIQLSSDVIVVCTLIIFEIVGYPVSPIVYVVLILLSENILNWFIKKQDELANKLMSKLIELANKKEGNKDSTNDQDNE